MNGTREIDADQLGQLYRYGGSVLAIIRAELKAGRVSVDIDAERPDELIFTWSLRVRDQFYRASYTLHSIDFLASRFEPDDFRMIAQRWRRQAERIAEEHNPSD